MCQWGRFSLTHFLCVNGDASYLIYFLPKAGMYQKIYLLIQPKNRNREPFPCSTCFRELTLKHVCAMICFDWEKPEGRVLT